MDPFADLDEARPAGTSAADRLRARLDELLDITGTTAGALAAGVLVVGVAVGALWWSSRAQPLPAEVALPLVDPADAVPATTTTPSPVVVHVAGAVQRPGVVVLTPGARGIDAVRAAGGLTADADADRINLAGPVVDGQHLVVPREGEPLPAPAATGDAPDDAGGAIDLNTATADQLQMLPGIGPATAEAIVEDRARNGPFATVDELLRVRGIGEAKLAALRDRVRVS